MSNHAEESRLLGIDFVSTYYGAMSSGKEEPKEWLSQLSVWTSGEEGVEPATQAHIVGREAISMEVEAFSGLQVELSVVDSQFSVNDGLFVLACGTVKRPGAPAGQSSRKFVQTFFLSKEATGYSINNSILRFLRDPEPVAAAPAPAAATTAPAATTTVVEADVAPAKASKKESSAPAPAADARKAPPASAPKQQESAPAAAAPKKDAQPPKQAAVDPKTPSQKPAAGKPTSFLDAVSRAPSTKNKHNASKRVPPKPKPAAAPAKKQTSSNGNASMVHHNLDAQCYVSNIPFSATNQVLRKALSKYGSVKNIIRPANKGYGFLQYENDADAERAIAESAKSPITMSGRRLNIERRTGKEESGQTRPGNKKRGGRGGRKGRGKN